MTLTQEIKVGGDGTMHSSVNTQASETIEVTGEQELTRTLEQGDTSSSLSTDYKLISTPYKKLDYKGSFKVDGDQNSQSFLLSKDNVLRNLIPNRYQIKAIDPNSVQHLVGVQGFDKIESISSISYEEEVSTNFDIHADGMLSESVIDLKSGKHQPIAETSISGSDFSITSGLTDEAFIGPEWGKSLNELEHVNMSGEKSFNRELDPFELVSPVTPSMLIGEVEDDSVSTSGLEKNKELRIQGAPDDNSCLGATCDLADTTNSNGNANGEEGNEAQPDQDSQLTLADIESIFSQGDDVLVGETEQSSYTTEKYGNTLFVTDNRCTGNNNSKCRNYVKIQSRMPKLNQLHVPLSAELHLFRRPIKD